MNIAVIFAGGTGSRMNSREKPKQFLLLYNKPIIVHTIEHFENHPLIDAIVVVCIKEWISYFQTLVYYSRMQSFFIRMLYYLLNIFSSIYILIVFSSQTANI